MGCRVVADDAGMTLRLDEHVLQLGEQPDWQNAIVRAKTWLDELTAEVGRRGETLANRRRALGFTDMDAFCQSTGLDAVETFEAEAGLASPKPVHLRILNWLESGELRLR